MIVSPPNTRFLSSPNEIRGEGREFIATKNTKSHEKLFCRGICFCGFSCPFVAKSQLPITRTVSNDFFPRISAKRSECCRPSAVANRSTFPPRLFLRSLHVSEAGRQFFSDQRRAQPGKNAFPSRRFAGRKTIATKNARKAALARHPLLWVFVPLCAPLWPNPSCPSPPDGVE